MEVLDDSIVLPVTTAGKDLKKRLEAGWVYVIGHGSKNGIRDAVEIQIMVAAVASKLKQDGVSVRQPCCRRCVVVDLLSGPVSSYMSSQTGCRS
jgi:hypothetical protein